MAYFGSGSEPSSFLKFITGNTRIFGAAASSIISSSKASRCFSAIFTLPKYVPQKVLCRCFATSSRMLSAVNSACSPAASSKQNNAPLSRFSTSIYFSSRNAEAAGKRLFINRMISCLSSASSGVRFSACTTAANPAGMYASAISSASGSTLSEYARSVTR